MEWKAIVAQSCTPGMVAAATALTVSLSLEAAGILRLVAVLY